MRYRFEILVRRGPLEQCGLQHKVCSIRLLNPDVEHSRGGEPDTLEYPGHSLGDSDGAGLRSASPRPAVALQPSRLAEQPGDNGCILLRGEPEGHASFLPRGRSAQSGLAVRAAPHGRVGDSAAAEAHAAGPGDEAV